LQDFISKLKSRTLDWKSGISFCVPLTKYSERSDDQKKAISDLLGSSSMTTRYLALLAMGSEADANLARRKIDVDTVPLAYKVVLSEKGPEDVPPAPKLEPSDSIPTPRTAEALFGIFAAKIDYISDASGIDVENLLLRGQQIAYDLSSRESFHSEESVKK